MSLSDNRRWLLRPDVVATIVNDGAVILDLRTKYFFSANATAWAIGQMFEMGATRTEVHAASHHWGAVNGDAAAIDAVIDQMISEGLVETSHGSAATSQVAVNAWMLPTLSKHQEPLQRIMVSAFDPGLPLAE
ncbi:MAG TPA: hypothetical protein VH255_08115 [Verrucomicrobiae bacterium]|jgi:hypothetical protein|nr:hypothetical protein [Verrucomicrobiae bacterium]